VLGQQIAVAMGLLPGLHDLCVLVPHEYALRPDDNVTWEPYFLEVKTPEGRRSGSQEELHKEFTKLRIKHRTVRSVDDTASAMAFWGILVGEKTS
jgi:hypothetical protein